MEPTRPPAQSHQAESSSNAFNLSQNQWMGRDVIIYCSKSVEKTTPTANTFEIARNLTSQGARVSIVFYNSSRSDDYSLCEKFSENKITFRNELKYSDVQKAISQLNRNTIHIDANTQEAKILENDSESYNINPINDQSLRDLFTEEKIKQNRKERSAPRITLDDAINCSDFIYNNAFPKIETALKKSEAFNHIAFINPAHQEKTTLQNNENLLSDCVTLIENLAQEIMKEDELEITTALKRIIGLLDRYDQDENRGFQSTFILRNAALIASNKLGHPLPSWLVYTKAGKPHLEEGRIPWDFLDKWENWVPEAQGMMVKFMEAQVVKAKALADSYPFENNSRIVLLKGGFGAGKTTLTRKLFPEQEEGVMGPDMGKRVVRRALPDISHYSTFTQGSQVVYKLFHDLLNSAIGTIVYDSPLESPGDITNYLKLCKTSNRKMEIYDVARNDTARFLTVLKRDFKDDPSPISVKGVLESTIRTKTNRVNCMNVVLNDDTEGKDAPVYHFCCSNEKGVDSQEVLTLSSNGVMKCNLSKEMVRERLALEYIELGDDQKLSFFLNEENLRAHYESILNQNVLFLCEDLSPTEAAQVIEKLSTRILPLIRSDSPIHDLKTLYDSLTPELQEMLTFEDFKAGFDPLDAGTLETFFQSIGNKTHLTYLDLPLRAALTVHSSLHGNPWK